MRRFVRRRAILFPPLQEEDEEEEEEEENKEEEEKEEEDEIALGSLFIYFLVIPLMNEGYPPLVYADEAEFLGYPVRKDMKSKIFLECRGGGLWRNRHLPLVCHRFVLKFIC